MKISRPAKAVKEWKPDGYIKSALRRIWRWSKKRRECLKAKVCVTCGKTKKKLFADHISPVVDPLVGFVDWNMYIDRMFNGELQSLCEKCHKAKSKEEAGVRAKARKARKLNDA